MSSINGFGNQVDYSSLFGSLSGNNTQAASNNFLSEYASIKNGSYLKLAKKYYSNAAEGTDKDAQDAVKEVMKLNNQVSASASGLKNAADALADSKSLFVKKETKDAEGNVKSDYDRDKIYKSIKSFVDNYNDAIKNGAESDNTRILRDALSLTNMTKKHSTLLSDVGITIGENNKLSVDEDKVKEADINTLKSLFSGGGSYAYMVSARASTMLGSANSENNKLGTYNAGGGYSGIGQTGNIYDGSY